MSARAPFRRAFSLIELLCAIMLLALAMGVLVWRACATDPGLRILEAASLLENADRFARSLGMSQGPCTLRCTDEGDLAVLLARGGAAIYERGLNGAKLSLASNRMEPIRAVEYDALGRCRDYIVTITIDNQACAWRICGESGWSERVPSR